VCYSLLSHARGGIEELSAHLSVGASAHVTRLGCWRNGFKPDSGAFTPSSSAAMPFERYLQPPQEPSSSASSSSQTNDYGYVQSQYPSSLGSALDLLSVPPPLSFLTPQFSLGGPPLPPGGGAETHPADLISSPESLASAWIANTSLTPHNPEDVYVQPRSSHLSPSTSLASFLRAQNITIPIELLRAITFN
jgi:hypothetical protein